MEILEHAFEQAGVALKAGAIDRRLAAGRRRAEQGERRTRIIVAEREAGLADRRLALANTTLLDVLDWSGTGLDALESVPAAFAAAMTEPVFENAVFAAVNAGGASDTVGALTGAIAGAAGGASGIPQDLIDGLEGRIYVSLAAPWVHKAARQRAGHQIDRRPVHGPRPDMPPRQ